MNRSDDVASALERWRIARQAPGTFGVPESVVRDGDELARLLREAQTEPGHVLPPHVCDGSGCCKTAQTGPAVAAMPEELAALLLTLVGADPPTVAETEQALADVASYLWRIYPTHPLCLRDDSLRMKAIWEAKRRALPAPDVPEAVRMMCAVLDQPDGSDHEAAIVQDFREWARKEYGI